MLIDDKGVLNIKQGGYYYNVAGNDALILHKYLGYKLYGVRTHRTGFPVAGQETVLRKIDTFSINYDVYSQTGELITSKRFPTNNYEVIDNSFYPLTTVEKNIEVKLKPKGRNIEDYFKTLEFLSDAVNPYTGEIISGIDEDLKKDIFEILLYFNNKVKYQKSLKEKFSNMGNKWTQEEDSQLISEYKNKLTFKQIAEIHNRSTEAIRSRLLKLNDIE